MGADGGDPPPVEEHHLVDQGQGRGAVGDDHRGAARHHLRQRLLDLGLDHGVHRRGGVVEDQDPRVAQHRPSQGDPLPLTAGQAVTPLPDHGGVSLGESADEVVGAGQPRRRPDLLVRGVGSTKGDVVPHRGREQERLLEHNRHLAPQLVQRDRAHIDPVEPRHSGVDVVEPGDEEGKGGLTGPGRTDQRHRGPARNGQVDPVEHRNRPVSEPHPGEGDLARAVGERHRIVGLARVGHGAEEQLDPGRRRRRPRQVGEEPAGDPDGEHQDDQILGVGDEISDGDGAVDHPEPAQPEHGNRSQRRDQLEQRAETGRHPSQGDGPVVDPVGGGVEPGCSVASRPNALTTCMPPTVSSTTWDRSASRS
ncbi:hypothetical protein BH24ACT7_BH24ACT7_07850 [soil metagenome]